MVVMVVMVTPKKWNPKMVTLKKNGIQKMIVMVAMVMMVVVVVMVRMITAMVTINFLTFLLWRQPLTDRQIFSYFFFIMEILEFTNL